MPGGVDAKQQHVSRQDSRQSPDEKIVLLKLSRMVCVCMNIEFCRNPVLQVFNSVGPPQSVDVGKSPKSGVPCQIKS